MRNIGTRGPVWRMGMDVALLILGIIFCASPMWASFGVDVAYGIILIVYGAMTIALDEIRRARHEQGGAFVWGCAWLAAGILLVVFAATSSGWLLPLIAGIWIILEGLDNVRAARVLHQTGESAASIASILAVAEVILGIITICGMTANPLVYATPISGVCMLLFGTCAVLSFLLGARVLRSGR